MTKVERVNKLVDRALVLQAKKCSMDDLRELREVYRKISAS